MKTEVVKTEIVKAVPLYLLTTVGCSLCNKAKQVLWQPLSANSLRLVEIDIVNHEHLLDRFATSIPVISQVPPDQIDTASTLLVWPFTEQDVQSWIAAWQ